MSYSIKFVMRRADDYRFTGCPEVLVAPVEGKYTMNCDDSITVMYERDVISIEYEKEEDKPITVEQPAHAERLFHGGVEIDKPWWWRW